MKTTSHQFLVMKSCNLHKSVCCSGAWKRSDQSSDSLRNFSVPQAFSSGIYSPFPLYPEKFSCILQFLETSAIEIDCKSDQQGCQSPRSEQNTIYLVLIDTLAEALHSGYCYQKIWSSSARQTAEIQLAAALGLWTRLPGKFAVAGYGMLQTEL